MAGERKFGRVLGGYWMELPEYATRLECDRLRWERGELLSELRVLSNWTGVRAYGEQGLMFAGNFNISSVRGRSEAGKMLRERQPAKPEDQLDWHGFLEEFCQRILGAERLGEPITRMADLVEPEDDGTIAGAFILLERDPVILWGDGGDGKSVLSLAMASSLATGHPYVPGWGPRPRRVLYADWEMSGGDHRRRLRQITGLPMPVDLWYVRCDRPLIREADRLRRVVREHSIDYLVCDSIAFACEGPPESAEVAGQYFRALQSIGVGSLNVAHRTKAEEGEIKPFGSAFWHNGARATWFLKRSEEISEDSITIGLFNRKANLVRKHAPVGYRITFAEDAIRIVGANLSESEDLSKELPLWYRLREALRSGPPRTYVELAEITGEKVDSVTKAIKRSSRTFARETGDDGIFRITLASERAS